MLSRSIARYVDASLQAPSWRQILHSNRFQESTSSYPAALQVSGHAPQNGI